jgi:hypothetical protein
MGFSESAKVTAVFTLKYIVVVVVVVIIIIVITKYLPEGIKF